MPFDWKTMENYWKSLRFLRKSKNQRGLCGVYGPLTWRASPPALLTFWMLFFMPKSEIAVQLHAFFLSSCVRIFAQTFFFFHPKKKHARIFRGIPAGNLEHTQLSSLRTTKIRRRNLEKMGGFGRPLKNLPPIQKHKRARSAQKTNFSPAAKSAPRA